MYLQQQDIIDLTHRNLIDYSPTDLIDLTLLWQHHMKDS
jgi:hypothetical protein